MPGPLFDINHNVESKKELWDSLESKYKVEDASSKKFLKEFKQTLKHRKDDLSLVQFGSHLRIEESLKARESDKGKGKEVVGPSVNMTEEGGKNKNNKQNKGKKRGFKDNNGGSGSNKKPKLECWKCGKTGHFKRDCRSGNKKNNASASDRCWFKTYEPVEDGSVLYMGDDHFVLFHEKGSVVFEFSYEKSITLFNVLYVPILLKNLISGPVLNKSGYKQVYESDKYILSKSGVFVEFDCYNNGMFILNLNKVPYDSGFVYISSSTVVNSSLWHARLGRIIHETTAPYTPQQNGVAERKNRSLKEMVNSMLSYSGLSDRFWGEAMLTACYLLNKVPNKRNKTTPYELWFYVIEPNDSVSINTIIESRDAIFDDIRFSSIPRPKDIIPNSDESQMDDHSNDVPIEGSKDQIGSQYSYCYSIEEDPRTYNEAMQSRDAAF
ncbi:zinc finger, CCHC-type containing protein [Tanacetum coccineum]